MNRYITNVFVVILLITLVILIFSRFNYRHIPFERDEGEYAYVGSLILHGFQPYKEAYNMKFPGTYFMYALIMKSGNENVESVRLGVLLILLFTSLGVAGIVNILTQNKVAALLAATMLVAFNSTMDGEGLMSNAEHFVNFCVVWGIFLLLKSKENHRKFYLLFASGLMLSLGVIMKQYGYAFYLFGLVILLADILRKSKQEILKSLLIFGTGSSIPLFLVAIWVSVYNLWDKFIFLTINYAKVYIGLSNGGPGKTLNIVIHGMEPLNYLVYFSLLMVCLFIFKSETRILLLWLLFSVVAFSTGFHFRLHYSLLLYPALAVTVAYAYFLFDKKLNPVISSIGITGILIAFFCIQSPVIFAESPQSVFNKHYQWSMFSEMPKIAAHINTLLPKDEKLSMFSNEPEIYFYSKRVAASGYIYTYPFFEKQKYNRQMFKEYSTEIKNNPSRLFVYHNGESGCQDDAMCIEASVWRNQLLDNYSLIGAYIANSDSSAVYLTSLDLISDSNWQSKLNISFWNKK